MEFPEPVISVAVEPKTKVDQEKMGLALQRLDKEDPSFRVHTDQESGQTIISGMGELHLEIIVDRMKREFKVDANVGKPQVAYRETIRATVESEGKFVRQSGGRGQYGHVWLKIEPQATGKGYQFVNGIVGGAVPREFIPAVDKGIQEAVQTGVIAGYPIVDVKVTIFDGSYHDVDSNEMAFKIAGSMGFKEGFRKAKPVLLQLANFFGSGKTVKTYLALLPGTPPNSQWEVDAPIGPHPAKPGLMRIDSKNGKQSRTRFEVQEPFRGFTLVRCQLLTERLHQIRVHLKRWGLPVCGDRLYGGHGRRVGRTRQRGSESEAQRQTGRAARGADGSNLHGMIPPCLDCGEL